MVNNYTNINNLSNNFSPQTLEHKKDHNIWHWKSWSWLWRKSQTSGRVKPV